MLQDYRQLTEDQHAALEKQTLFAIVQALQEYSREAKRLFDYAVADGDAEVIVVAEDICQYALEVAEVYPIDERFAGFTDYKRVRWLSTSYGIVPQALLVDAKASTEDHRANLQRSQLPMNADFMVGRGAAAVAHQVLAGLPQHLVLIMRTGQEPGQTVELPAPTTSVFVHFFYTAVNAPVPGGPVRDLHAIIAFCIPHSRFKTTYNPDANLAFWQKGKESPGRGEAVRIRVTLAKLSEARRWRLQRLDYANGKDGYTAPVWQDDDVHGNRVATSFLFKGR